MTGRAIHWLLALCLLLGLTGCAGAPAPPASGGIVYGDGERLWIAEASTTGARTQREIITIKGKGTVADPAWSPDRALIAYSRLPVPEQGASFGADIHVVGPDGRGDRAIFTHDIDGGLARSPAWAPDGTAIYFSYSFVRQVPGQTALDYVQRIERIELATGARAVVAVDADLPALAPDGASLVYVRLSPDGFAPSSLWIVPVGGGEARPLVDDQRFQALWAPRFSPDGRHVLFTAFSPNPADRARPRLNVASPRSSGDPRPAMVAAHGFPMDFWLVEVATGKLELLAALAGDDLFGAWSPDGQRLAYVAIDGLFVLDLAAGTVISLASMPAFGSLDWAEP